jgi:lysophospholipase L1-like esterase
MKNFLLLGITTLILFIVLEVFLRIFYPLHYTGYVGAYQYDKDLAVRLKSGIHFLKTTDYQQEIRTNRLGTVNFQESFDSYKKIVYAVGDSYTQGTGLPSDSSYPFQLDLLLNIKNGSYHPEYAVINLGLASYGGKQSLIVLKRYIELIGPPDYVLYMGAFNDQKDDALFESGYMHKQMVDGNPHFGVFLKQVQWLSNEVEVGKRLKRILAVISREAIFKGSDKKVSADKEQITEDHVVSVAFKQKKVLDELKRIAQDHNAGLIVSYAGDTSGQEGSYDWMRNWAKENNVNFADWRAMTATLKNKIPELPDTNNHSGGHYRSWVNHMIARSYAEHIK